MKTTISYLSLIAFFSTTLFFTACKKTAATSNNSSTVTDAQLKTQADDQQRVTNETNAVADDANTSLENSSISNAGQTPTAPLLPAICDYTVTIDTTVSPRTITLTYSGSTCFANRTRSGKVVISFSPDFRWAKAGSFYTLTFQNLKITRVSDGKSLTFNGSKTITNVSGGKLRNLATSATPIIHTITSSQISITFDDSTQRVWQVARQRTFTYNNGIVVSETGIGTASQGLVMWGTNRFNNAFTTTIINPLVVEQSCDFRLVSGTINHSTGNYSATTTFGLDMTGAPVTTCPSGSFYFKTVWTGPAGKSYTVIAPY